MARPTKATVDYFPHTTEHGKTMFILQSLWGNDGYAVWFKILERLGSLEGHYIDCRDISEWEFLMAHCRVDTDTLTAILDKCAGINAIDTSLWRQKLIYSQNFVDGIKDAYRRRPTKLPTRESVCSAAGVVIDGRNPAKDEFKPSITHLPEILTPRPPHLRPFQGIEATTDDARERSDLGVIDGRNPPQEELLTAETPLNDLNAGNNREREREREREIKDTACPKLSKLQAPEPIFIAIPLVDKSDYQVTIPMIEEWKNLFPKVDVEQELRGIRAWNLARPKQRKTRAGVMGHITTWLAKEQDRGRNGNGNGNGTSNLTNGTGKTLIHAQRAQSDGEPWPQPTIYGPE